MGSTKSEEVSRADWREEHETGVKKSPAMRLVPGVLASGPLSSAGTVGVNSPSAGRHPGVRA